MEERLTSEELQKIDGQLLLDLYEIHAKRVEAMVGYKKLLWEEICRRLKK